VGVGFSASNAGVKFNTQLGMASTTVSWAAPVAGTFTVSVSATDSAGKSSWAYIPLVITAK
jgi:hypothetical protein